MQTISLMNPARAPRRIIAISIGLLSTLLLASCGGAGSTDPNATAQSADDGTKTIQAVSGSTAVSGTWTDCAVAFGSVDPPPPHDASKSVDKRPIEMAMILRGARAGFSDDIVCIDPSG